MKIQLKMAFCAFLCLFSLLFCNQIVKAQEITESFVATYGDTLAAIALPEDYQFVDSLETPVGDVGEHRFLVNHADSDGTILETIEVRVLVGPREASLATVSNISNVYFHGGPVTQNELTVHWNGTLLKLDEDYTLVYNHNTSPGKATVTIVFQGNYSGSITKDFTIYQEIPIPNQIYTVDGLKYQVIESNEKGGKVTLVGATNKKLTSLTIPKEVSIHGYPFIIRSIGAKAFYGCSNLRSIKILATTITSVGYKALVKLHKDAEITVPSTCYAKYKKLFSGKCDAKFVKVQLGAIVNTKDSKYSYADMKKDLLALAKRYPSTLKVKVIGKSHDNRNLYCVVFGNENAKKQMAVDSCIHAREWLNALFMMEKIEYFATHMDSEVYNGQTFRELISDTCLYMFPMINPDGVTISQYGPKAIHNKSLRRRLKKMSGIKTYRRWKANARGVDLNMNFTKGWTRRRGSRRPGNFYSGRSAGSEKETKAFMKALRGMKHLVRVVNYHSMGEVMYCNKKAKGSVGAAIGKMRAKVRALTKYRTIWETSTGKKSGCLSDYIIYKLKVASITLETGRYKCPLAFSQYGRVRSKNKRVIEAMLSLS